MLVVPLPLALAFAATYTLLAINGAQITADADATYAFISGLFETHTSIRAFGCMVGVNVAIGKGA